MDNILVTSISAKVPLLKSIANAKDRFDKNIKIIGSDIDKKVIGRYFVDKFLKLSTISKIDIENFIYQAKKLNITYIIPTRDEDTIFFSKYKTILKKNGIFIFAPNYKIAQKCYDKLNFADLSKNAIATFKNYNDIAKDRIVIKERFGAGSKNIKLNVSKQKVKNYIKNFQQPIFQPFIAGKEYSVDSYVNQKGKCLGTIVRSRDVVINGESKVTTRVIDKELEKIVKNLLEKNRITGHSVTQVIRSKDNYHIIECNTRFGGASTLSLKLGLDSFYWFLQECHSQKIQVNISKKMLKQVRVSQDIYLEC